jgi:outer membrane protein assembly factor BamB
MKKIKDKSARIGLGIIVLVVMCVIIGMAGLSCVQGLNTIGWSGGAISGDVLYVGSEEGRLVSVDMTDGSRQFAEALKSSSSSGGLFGCSSMTAGCGGTPSVAIYGTPAVSGDLVYIAGYNGKVYAYAKDGLALRWVYPRDSYLPSIVGSVVVANDIVYFGTSGGKYDGNNVGGAVLALDAFTGDPVWDSPYFTDDKIWATPLVDSDTLYIGSFDKKVCAIDATTGVEKWTYLTEGSVIAGPLIVDNTIYIGSLDRNFYALDAGTGAYKWSFMGENWFWSQAVFLNGKIYAANLDGKVYVLDPATGSLIDSYDLEESLAASPVINGTDIIFATRRGAVYKIDTVLNQADLLATLEDVTINGPLAINDGIIYVHTQDMELVRINADTGKVFDKVIDLKSGT